MHDCDPQGILCAIPCEKRKNIMADTTITHEDTGDDLRRILIEGRLDTPGTESISAELHELAAAPKRAVIIDLSSVEFAASIGIGQLIATAQEVKARGGHVVLLARGTGMVMTTLKMGAIDRVIPVYETLPDAHVGALRGF